MANRFWDDEKQELNDKEIIKALEHAAIDYANGELLEVVSVCQEIQNAIALFEG